MKAGKGKLNLPPFEISSLDFFATTGETRGKIEGEDFFAPAICDTPIEAAGGATVPA